MNVFKSLTLLLTFLSLIGRVILSNFLSVSPSCSMNAVAPSKSVLPFIRPRNPPSVGISPSAPIRSAAALALFLRPFSSFILLVSLSNDTIILAMFESVFCKDFSAKYFDIGNRFVMASANVAAPNTSKVAASAFAPSSVFLLPIVPRADRPGIANNMN